MADIKWYGEKEYQRLFVIVQKNMLTAAIVIESQIKRVINRKKIVDTGRLLSSITFATGAGESSSVSGAAAKAGDSAISSPGNTATLITARAGTRVHYAPHLEFGTEKMAARPFIRTGFAEAKAQVVKILLRRNV